MASPQITIGIEHQKVHEGKSFTVNYLEKAVPNNSFVRLLVKTGVASAHIIIEIEAEGKVYFRTIANPVVTVNGTPPSELLTSKLTLFNRLGALTNSNATQVFFSPTFTGGKLRGNRMLPLGTGGTASGGGSTSRIESLFTRDREIIIEVQNVSGQARDIGIVLDWYEEVFG